MISINATKDEYFFLKDTGILENFCKNIKKIENIYSLNIKKNLINKTVDLCVLEFAQKGIGNNDEPTPYGEIVDSVIGKLTAY